MSDLTSTPGADPMKAGRTAMEMGLGAAVAILIVALLVLAWPRLAGHGQPARFGVVDLASVVRKNQEAAVSLLANASADQAARDAALAGAQSFGKRLDAAVVALSKECGCVLLMREAVVAGDVEDMTPALVSQLTKQGGKP